MASRTDLRTGMSRFIRPRGQKLRFNWSTPFILSPHNPHTVYFGANMLFKSVDRGDHWKAISPDLTTNNPQTLGPSKLSVSPEDTGAETHCTIITISESPTAEGQIWVGTDDGQVQVTKDGGANWANVTRNIPDLPVNTWCSRVLASRWKDGRAYATFDGHRAGDFKPYLYRTDDFGKTWTRLGADLPDFDCLYVVLEGQKNQDLLFLGSEKSLRVSLDSGKTWSRITNKFPTVAVHDLVIQPKELDLVIGTHGRSLWTLDINGLEGLTADSLKQDVALLHPQDVLFLGRVNSDVWDGDRVYAARNSQPGTRIEYYLAHPAKNIKLSISSPDGSDSRDLDPTNLAGLNVVSWNGRVSVRVVPGDYRVSLTVDGKEYATSVHVEEALLNKG
jgi:photosystem II stability/assembly factor-like uncharacterized protein